MWTPKQLLHGKVIDALFIGGFTKLQIEFLGWLSYNAAALNNSRNPVKAAHTLLAKDSTLKMLRTFTNRKTESIDPEVAEQHPEADEMFRRLEDTIDTAVTKAAMRATTYEDFTEGGVSDGEGSITDDREEVDAVIPTLDEAMVDD
jgi:hypothetical protein